MQDVSNIAAVTGADLFSTNSGLTTVTTANSGNGVAYFTLDGCTS